MRWVDLMHTRKAEITACIFSALVVTMTLSYWNIQQDDSYIFYTYAENLANGNGYVFNEGERVNATTSPLYTVAVAATYFLTRWLPGISIPLVGHLIGAISIWVLAMLSMRMFSATGLEVVPFVFPVLLLSNPLLRYAVGMETFLTLALLALSIYLYQRERLVWTAIACAFAVLSRPDALILPAILMIDFAVAKRRLPPLLAMLMFLVILLPWGLFSYGYFGTLLPSTLGAKLAQTDSGRWGSGFLFLRGLLEHLGSAMLSGILIVAAYLLAMSKRWTRHRVVVLILSWSLVYLFAYGILLNPPGYPWYYTPLSLGMTLLFALVIEMIVPSQASIARARLSTYLVWILLVIGPLALVGHLKTLSEPVTSKYTNYKLAAEWLNEHAKEGASVAANEIGVLGYYYKRGKIIDALGLVTPGIAEHVSHQDYAWYVHNYQPDFLMFDYPRRPILEDMVTEPWFKEQYHVGTIINIGSRAVAIYQKQSSLGSR